ncbi:MAG: hypothetical protein Q9171_004293, partial [Xanthocarpia ochracea]
AVLEECEPTSSAVILRIPVLYGPAEHNAESAINVLIDAVWKAQDKDAAQPLPMDDWSLRYPTNTTDVARVLLDIATKYLAAETARVAMPKILHFSAEQRFTKYEICEIFAEILGLPLGGMIAKGEDKDAKPVRPYDTHLSNKVLRDLGVDVRAVDFGDWWYVYLFIFLLSVGMLMMVRWANFADRKREMKAFRR